MCRISYTFSTLLVFMFIFSTIYSKTINQIFVKPVGYFGTFIGEVGMGEQEIQCKIFLVVYRWDLSTFFNKNIKTTPTAAQHEAIRKAGSMRRMSFAAMFL